LETPWKHKITGSQGAGTSIRSWRGSVACSWWSFIYFIFFILPIHKRKTLWI